MTPFPNWLRRLWRRKEIVMRLNENTIAREIAKREGKKIQVSIAQIKEIQHHLLDILAEADGEAVRCLIKRHARPKD